MFPADGSGPTFATPVAAAAAVAKPSASSSPSPAAAPRAVAMPPLRPASATTGFEVGGMIAPERNGIRRHRGFDHGSGKPVPVVIVATAMQPLTVIEEPIAVAEAVDEEIVPSFDFDMPGATPVAQAIVGGEPRLGLASPGNANARESPASCVPTVVDSFIENDVEYLVESAPAGRNIWDAWDDLDSTSNDRYTWLQQIVLGLDAVHLGGAIFDGLTPDMLSVTDAGQAYISDLSGLIPFLFRPEPRFRRRFTPR
ncbi:MAG: hypothetical protein U0744_19520 [Gemmataceae bacterium]